MTTTPVSHFRTCNLCEALCGIEITVNNQEIVSIQGDRQDPFSRGHICPKAVALKDVHLDPNRLRQPVRRTPTGWEPISWETAFDEVATRLRSVQAQHGVNAVGVYLGNPNVHNYGSILFGPLMLKALGTKNRFSATSVDQLPHHFSGFFLYGHQLMLPIPDIDRTDFLLIVGGNPVVSNGSLMSAPDVADRLKEIRQRGGKVIVVDPRRTETAAIADEHFFIRPGTDVYFLLGMLNTLLVENRVQMGRLAEFTDNLEQLRPLVESYSAEVVADVTGIPAEAIRRLARDFAAAPSAVCYGRMGVSVQEFGATVQWLIQVFNIVTGNLDRPGGAMFTLPAFDAVDLTGRMGRKGHFGKWRSRVRNLPEFGGELPVVALAEEILTEGPGQIRALVTSAGNPVLSTPNGSQLETALAGLDFMVSVDFYINETTRHAHIILPPAAGLEHENYDVVFHVLAIRNTTKYTPALFPADSNSRHDWEIFLELFLRLGGKHIPKKEHRRIKRWLAKRNAPEVVLDWALRNGPYGSRFSPLSQQLTLHKLKQHPHGIDLGPLQPCLPQRLFTPDKRINLLPEVFTSDLARVERRFLEITQETSSDHLWLISRRHLRSNNSWMHNAVRLVRGKDRCTLLMNPQDAETRQIQPGQQVTISSRVGKVQAKVEITAEMMPGVVSLPHGWGHHREGIQMDVAQKFAGVSVNDLTDDSRLDELSGNAALSGVPVSVVGIG